MVSIFVNATFAQHEKTRTFYLLDTIDLNSLHEIDKQRLDSSLTYYHQSEEDSSKLNILLSLAVKLNGNNLINYQYATLLGENADALLDSKSLSKVETIFYKRMKGKALELKGYYHSLNGNALLAKQNYKEAMNLFREINDLKSFTNVVNRKVVMMVESMELNKAMSLSLKVIKVREYLKDTAGLVGSYLNMGNINFLFGKREEILKDYNKALQYAMVTQDPVLIIKSLNNKALGFYLSKNFERTLAIYQKVDSIINRYPQLIKYQSKNVGLLYYNMNKLEKAESFYLGSLENALEIEDHTGAYDCMLGLTLTSMSLGKKIEAEDYANRAFLLAKKLEDNTKLTKSYRLLSDLYSSDKKWKKAYTMQTKYHTIRDSIINQKNKDHILKAQLDQQYEERRNKMIREQERKDIVAAKEKEKQQLKMYAGTLLLIIVSVLLLILFNRFKLVQRQKEIIENYSSKLEYKTKQLEKSNQEIILKGKYKEEFLANMSHEIRTPLHAIIGYAKLMSQSLLLGKQKKHLDVIERSSENLLAIINDILDYSKIEAGKIELEQKPFDLRNTIDKIISIIQLDVDKKNLKLSLFVDDLVPKFIVGDSVRLEQILINLLSNAVKFTAHGGIMLHVSAEKTADQQYDIDFMVKDTGIGIPEEKQKTIFEKFSQADSSSTRQYGGTGLGLAICSKLVKLHGSELQLKSMEDVGSAFFFTINYTAEKTTLPHLNSDENKDIYIKGIEQKKILVADDNKINRMMIVDLFAKWNKKVTVDTVKDGLEAVQKIKDHQYDLILMDLHMPQMDGIAATKHIREKLKNNITIIALTASVLLSNKKECIAAGMNDFVFKPFTLFKLLEVIAKNLGLEFHSSREISSGKNVKQNYEYINPVEVFNISKEPKRIKEIINMLVIEIEEDLQLLQKQIENKQWKPVLDTAHKIANNAGYLGNKSFLELAVNIEIAANANIQHNKNHPIDGHQLQKLWGNMHTDLISFVQALTT